MLTVQSIISFIKRHYPERHIQDRRLFNILLYTDVDFSALDFWFSFLSKLVPQGKKRNVKFSGNTRKHEDEIAWLLKGKLHLIYRKVRVQIFLCSICNNLDLSALSILSSYRDNWSTNLSFRQALRFASAKWQQQPCVSLVCPQCAKVHQRVIVLLYGM